MRVRIDPDRCEGHGRCYALAPELFEADDIGNGREVGEGTVPVELADKARLAVENCPERAITSADPTRHPERPRSARADRTMEGDT